MNNDQLFIHKLGELRRMIASGTDGDLISASAVLRFLLIEGSRFVHVVNREHHMTLRFEIAPEVHQLLLVPGEIEFGTQGIDPARARHAPSVTVNLEELLDQPLFVIDGKYATVRDVISFVANVQGGVHRGTPKKTGEWAVARHNAAFDREPSEGQDKEAWMERTVRRTNALHSIREIGAVVLKGLAQLEAAVNARLG
jgi:hypothetical protein